MSEELNKRVIKELGRLDLGEMFEHPCFQQFADVARSKPKKFARANGVKIPAPKTCGHYVKLYEAKVQMAVLQGVPESELVGLMELIRYSKENPDNMAVYVFLNCTGYTAQLFFGVSEQSAALIHTTLQQMSREAFNEAIGR